MTRKQYEEFSAQIERDRAEQVRLEQLESTAQAIRDYGIGTGARFAAEAGVPLEIALAAARRV